MQTLGPLKLKKTGLEVRPAVFSEQTENPISSSSI